MIMFPELNLEMFHGGNITSSVRERALLLALRRKMSVTRILNFFKNQGVWARLPQAWTVEGYLTKEENLALQTKISLISEKILSKFEGIGSYILEVKLIRNGITFILGPSVFSDALLKKWIAEAVLQIETHLGFKADIKGASTMLNVIFPSGRIWEHAAAEYFLPPVGDYRNIAKLLEKQFMELCDSMPLERLPEVVQIVVEALLKCKNPTVDKLPETGLFGSDAHYKASFNGFLTESNAPAFIMNAANINPERLIPIVPEQKVVVLNPVVEEPVAQTVARAVAAAANLRATAIEDEPIRLVPLN